MAVLGASGSGKSSVVRAGLVPRLRSDPETAWDVVTMVPTDRPLNSLVNALSPLLWPDLEDEVDRREKANETTASLEKGKLSLRDLAEIALKQAAGDATAVAGRRPVGGALHALPGRQGHPLLHRPVTGRLAEPHP